MFISVLFIILTFFLGLLAGIWNTLAGGGSFFTLPVLMLMGLPASVANVSVFLVLFFFAGIFGGFIQAGVRFILIIVLMLGGFDLALVNAMKVFMILVISVFALFIFISTRKGQKNMY